MSDIENKDIKLKVLDDLIKDANTAQWYSDQKTEGKTLLSEHDFRRMISEKWPKLAKWLKPRNYLWPR